jgi:type VI protein secretion system component Hcp
MAEGPLRATREDCMADDDVGGYLTFDGIAGTSANPKHRNSIEILSFSFGRKGLSEVSLVKASDSASPKLVSAVNTGKNFDSVVLEWFGRDRESDGGSLIGLSSPDPVRWS